MHSPHEQKSEIIVEQLTGYLDRLVLSPVRSFDRLGLNSVHPFDKLRVNGGWRVKRERGTKGSGRTGDDGLRG